MSAFCHTFGGIAFDPCTCSEPCISNGESHHMANPQYSRCAARLEFAIEAVKHRSKSALSSSQLERLQSWLLRRPYFDIKFVNKIDAFFERERNHRMYRPHDVVPDSSDNAYTKLQIQETSLTRNVYLPSRLLRGPWTTARMDTMARLHCWGARVPDMHHIFQCLPQNLLSSAVSEGNPRAIRLVQGMTDVRFTAGMFTEAVRKRHSRELLNEILTARPWSSGNKVDWEELQHLAFEWAAEGDPTGVWLKDVVNTGSRSTWLLN